MNGKVVIIGGGFCGIMTAVYLMRLNMPMEIIIVNDGYPFGKGVAYSAHTNKYLLNVRAVNMSAFEQDRYHFLNWLHEQKEYAHIPLNILTNVYAPRKVYGSYLQNVWQQAIKDKNPQTTIDIIEQRVTDIVEAGNGLQLHLDNNKIIAAATAVLATGNTAPRHISIKNKDFLKSDKYFSNPWTKDVVANVRELKKILIVGNGLTMVDVVQGVLQNGFKGRVYTVSPNGFKLIPHKYNLLVYDKIATQFAKAANLKEMFLLVRKHIKWLTDAGIGAHLVIDALRPFTQESWQNFSLEEKKFFMKKLSHSWSILRHRIPIHIYELLQQMRIEEKLVTMSGTIKDIREDGHQADVTYFDKLQAKEITINVDRVINCTGPEQDIKISANELLRNLAAKGTIVPDVLRLGIEADAITGAVINSNGIKSETIFTTGSNLKGILWENTAVPDIRVHVKQVAQHMESKFKKASLSVEHTA